MDTGLILILTNAFQLFLVLDPIGNTGVIASLISGFRKERQRKIIIREIIAALLLLLIAYFAGSYILGALNISQAAITITGGIIFFLFALSLLFPGSAVVQLKNLEEEPFIVPIAIPLIVGPSSLATVILLSGDKSLWISSLASIFIAWIVTAAIILAGPYLLLKMGKTGMLVTERIIGMICTLVAVKMLLKGVKLFIESLELAS